MKKCVKIFITIISKVLYVKIADTNVVNKSELRILYYTSIFPANLLFPIRTGMIRFMRILRNIILLPFYLQIFDQYICYIFVLEKRFGYQ